MNAPERIGQDELRTIQMGLLREFARQCDVLGIPWFVTAGTLLGAVRHRGYIPWDDDIDVMMARSDFERFCSAFVGGEVELASARTDDTYPFPFAKLYDPRTRVIEHYSPMPRYGVHIDIFPVDAWPRFRAAARCERLALGLLRVLLGVRIVRLQAVNGTIARRLVMAAQTMLRPFDPAVFGRLITSLVARDPRPGGRCGVIAWGGAESVRTDGLDEAVSLPFEDMHVPAPADWHAWLTAYYGDYMRLPPEADRVGHPWAVPYRVET